MKVSDVNPALLPCTSDPDAMFSPERVGAAKGMCMRCPVMQQCRIEAIETGQWDGVWGGMTPDERRDWAKANGIPRHGTLSGYTGDKCRCEQCRAAMTEYDRSTRPRKPCGTDAAYRRHLKSGEEPCRKCRAAHRMYNREAA